MTICGCPDAVVYSLRKIVRDELNKVRAIKQATLFFDEAVRDVVGLIFGDISAAVAAIPAPLFLDFLSIVEYLQCPLLPLALGLEITAIEDLDPTVVLEKVRQLKAGEVDDARRAYEQSFAASPQAKLINIARTYVKELSRLGFDQAGFARAVLISATVLQTCGEEEYQNGPYQDFANEITSFSMQNGVPSTLSDNSAAVVQKLQEGDAKLKALRVTIAV